MHKCLTIKAIFAVLGGMRVLGLKRSLCPSAICHILALHAIPLISKVKLKARHFLIDKRTGSCP